MNIVDCGSGTPLVLIPGIQGRWEYMQAAIESLRATFRVISFSLADEPAADAAPVAAHEGFDRYVDHVRAAMDAVSVDRAVMCGISFGGLVALHAAAAMPDRTLALILVSTPGPGWHLRRRHQVYARWPRVFGPMFLAESPWRMRREIKAAFPRRAQRLRFARSQVETLMRAPVSVTRMAQRARLIGSGDVFAACARITAPTLVVTGEAPLDHVVPVEGSSGYVDLIRGAHEVVLPRTGHLGSVTRPDAFAAIVREFVDPATRTRAASARAGGSTPGDVDRSEVA